MSEEGDRSLGGALNFDPRRALAEFLVIVTGVLVALAVDDWRESRQERETERHLLAVLAEDLRLDSIAYDSHIRMARIRIASAVRLLEDLGESEEVTGYFRETRSESFQPTDRPIESIPPSVDRQGEDLLRAAMGWSLSVSRVAMEELTSTGRLPLVNPAELRTELVRYDQLVASAMDVSHRSELALSGLRSVLRNQGISSLDPLFTEGLLDRITDASRTRSELREVINMSEGEWQIVSGLQRARGTLSENVAIRQAEVR